MPTTKTAMATMTLQTPTTTSTTRKWATIRVFMTTKLSSGTIETMPISNKSSGTPKSDKCDKYVGNMKNTMTFTTMTTTTPLTRGGESKDKYNFTVVHEDHSLRDNLQGKQPAATDRA